MKDHRKQRSLVVVQCTRIFWLLRTFLLHKKFAQDEHSIGDGTHPCVPTTQLPNRGYAVCPSVSHGFQLVFRDNAALLRTLPSLFNSIIEKCGTETVLRAVERALEIFTLSGYPHCFIHYGVSFALGCIPKLFCRDITYLSNAQDI